MARKTKEEAQKTRQAILNSALKLFCDKGVAETSLTDIANTTGVTRGAIYWYFKNKNELFVALWSEICEPLSHLMLASIDEKEPDPLGKLRSFLIQSLQSVANSRGRQQMFAILFNFDAMSGELAEIHAHAKSQYQQFVAHLYQALHNAQQKGQLPSYSDIGICADLLASVVDGNILRLVQLKETYPLHDRAEAIIDLAFQTIKMN